MNIREADYFDVAKGNTPGHRVIHKYGKNPNVSVGTFSAVWNDGGAYTGFAEVAETVTVVSTSIADVADTGTGMWTVKLYGLDADGLEQTETISLNGTTAVTSTKSYLRLDRAKGLTAGVTNSNVGDITIAQSITTANIFAVIPATYNTTMAAVYTVPSNCTGYIVSQRASIAHKNAAIVNVRIQVRSPGRLFTANGEASLNSSGSSFVAIDFEVPVKIGPFTDLFIEADASTTCAVTAFMDIILVTND